MEILLVTGRGWPDLIEDEAPLVAALKAQGFTPRTAIWNDPAESWDSAPAMILRTVWDYFDHPAEFDQWLALRQAAGNCLNPAAMCRWNSHKAYLSQLSAQGVGIPRTVDIPAGQPGDVNSIEGPAILKPAVSGAAQGCERFGVDDRTALAAALKPCDFDRLLQEYLPSIESEGEWSLIFFGGKFSHAVRKVPAAGDFRVQTTHGGRYEAGAAPALFPEAAAAALAAIPKDLGEALYARVDMVDAGPKRGPLLMELELIEPQLFFSFHPTAADNFVNALTRRLKVVG